MKKKSKRMKRASELIQSDRLYSLEDGIGLLKEYSTSCAAKFDETVDVVFKLGVDPRQSDQMVRGAVVMPSGMGREVKVAVFIKQERVGEAEKAGADLFGEVELIDEVKSGVINFDVCVATPDMMQKIAVLGKVLGPRGLMPNVKLGTVSDDVAEAVRRIKSGQVEYKVEKAGLVHAAVGKLSFSQDALKANVVALYKSVLGSKPTTSKGIYMQKMFLSSAQGPAIELDLRNMID